MPRPLTHIQEDIHRSYVSAVISSAGFRTNTANGQEYGSDLIVSQVKRLPNGKYTDTGINLILQLKSSHNAFYDGSSVVYDMEADAFNKIANWEGNSPCILVLFKIPEDNNAWVSVSEDGLILKDCCFWSRITHPTNNNSSVRIRIPRDNIFNEEAVYKLFKNIRNLDDI